jgi:hypothetical protein
MKPPKGFENLTQKTALVIL